MELQERKLYLGEAGDEVRLLHSKLRLLGLDIPAEERQAGLFGQVTHQAVLDLQAKLGVAVSGEVDEVVARRLNLELAGAGQFTLQGQVRSAAGAAAAGLVVELFDKTLGGETWLGRAETDSAGRYEIHYPTDKFDKPLADLLVRVTQADGTVLEAQHPAILFAAPPVAVQDITLATAALPQPSAYEQLVGQIKPHLGDTPLADLQPADVEYLAGKAGAEPQQIEWLVQSQTLSQATGLPPGALYAWSRENLAADTPTLLQQSQASLKRALQSALDQNLIPALAEKPEKILGQVLDLKIEAQLQPGQGRASLGDLLGTMPTPLDSAKQRDCAEAYLDSPGEGTGFWEAIKNNGFGDDEIGSLKVTLQLGRLTHDHPPLMQVLQQLPHRPDDADSLRYLAWLDDHHWNYLVETHGLPPDPSGDKTEYAAELARAVAAQHPTAVIAARLEQNRLPSLIEVKPALQTFFADNPAFEFGGQPVPLFLAAGGPAKLDKVQDQDKERLIRELQRLERVVNIINPRRQNANLIPETNRLLQEGFDSAQHILRLGKRDFVQKIGAAPEIGPDRADTLYANAEHNAAMAVALFARYSQAANPIDLAVLPQYAKTQFPTSPNIPDLQTLFGPQDYCECEHCRSVYSPAAYLVDMLTFLQARPSKDPTLSVKDVLFQRRPDLGEIDLTCANTNIAMPYVDLVNEILENAVAPFTPKEISPMDSRVLKDLVDDLNKEKLPNEVKDGLKEAIPPVSVRAKVAVITEGRRWRIDDGARHWVVQYQPSQLNSAGDDSTQVIEIDLDSKDTAELKAGKLPPKILKMLKGTFDGRIQPYTNPQISPKAKGKGWDIAYELSGLIKWREHKYFKLILWLSLEIFGLEPQILFYQDSNEAIDAVKALNQGQLSPALLESVSNFWNVPPNGLRIDVAKKDEVWRVTYATQATIFQEPKLIIDSYTLQTPDAPAELSANPEHLNIKAYEELDKAVHPWSLPFNLGLAEARLYLGHLGLTRSELMEAFFQGQPDDAWNDPAIAKEYLGLTPTEADLITKSDPPKLWKYWGFSAEKLDTANSIPDPADRTKTITQGKWSDVLAKRADVVLQQSDLSYRELLGLLEMRFINPKTAVTLPQDGCTPKDMALKGLNEPTLDRLHRFVRLWRRLGWPMHDLDKAITALNANKNSKKFDDSLLVGLSHLRRLQTALKLPVVTMLSWWADLDAVAYTDYQAEGQPSLKSLYEQLFRNKAVINPLDEVFVEDAGSLKGNLSAHRPAILAALGLSAADLGLLTSGPTDDTLNLANLSALFRNTSLAKALKLTVPEFLTVKQLVGIDPFGSTGQTLDFVDKVGLIRSAGFSIAELDYLLRHTHRSARGLAPDDAALAAILANLRSGLRRVRQETEFGPDPTGDLLRSKLALIWPTADLLETGMAMISGDFLADAKDDADKTKRREKAKAFIEENFARFLVPRKKLNATRTKLVAQPPKTEAKREAQKPERFELVLRPLLAYLRGSLSQNLIIQSVSQALAIDAASAELLLTKALASRRQATGLMMADFMALLDGGLWANYYNTDNLTGNSAPRLDPQLDFDWQAGSPDPAIGVNNFSARWAGWLEPEFSESYTFTVEVDDGVRLWMDNQLLIHQWAEHDSATYAATIPLKAGQLYALKMEYYEKTGQAVARLKWSSPSTPEAVVPQKQLVPQTTMESLLLLHKAAYLVNKLKLTTADLSFWLESGPQWGGFDFNKLPVTPDTASPTFAAWEQFTGLFHLRELLPGNTPSLPELLNRVVAATSPAVVNPGGAKQDFLTALNRRTLWPIEDLEALVGQQDDEKQKGKLNLTFPDDFKDYRTFLRLHRCFKLLARLGLPVDQAGKLAEKKLEAAEVGIIKQAVKAKFDDQTWPERAKPLRDQLRQQQRAALVAYLVANQKWRDVNDLYDRYLIDVEMDACMQTSRIKQALSSVQLFVQRCLMNLAPEVSPGAIDLDQWKWMKQYRVWEANRKIFLYPENWLEPELRDDKTPFFEELENDLLQNDITPETVETAFRTYLEKLDGVARLEIVGMYHQQEAAEGLDILHVFGRTFNTPHIYYYRRWVDASYWTAWARVDLDIQGDHLIPVVWNRRLYLFWPIFTEKTNQPTEAEKKAGTEPRKYWEIQLAWSEYKSGRWSAKSLSPDYLDTRKINFPLIYGPDKRLPHIGRKKWLFRAFDIGNIQAICFCVVVPSTSPDSDSDFSYMFAYFELSGTKNTFQLRLGNLPGVLGSLITPERTIQEYMMSVEQQNNIPSPSSTLPDYLRIPFGGRRYGVLSQTPGTFRLLIPSDQRWFDGLKPFFYQDDHRTYFISVIKVILNSGYPVERLRFTTYFHAAVHRLIEALNRKGIAGTLASGNQDSANTDNIFRNEYGPTEIVFQDSLPQENTDFEPDGAYALYTWELFFHIPLLFAARLSQNQRFEEAQQWFHYIFDPTDNSSGPEPGRFWRTRPFHEAGQGNPLDELLKLLATEPDKLTPEERRQRAELTNLVDRWRKDPFKPHLIARWRPVAYQKAVVMKYLDNLIAWGDQLFRRETIEATNEAILLYVLAAQILGRRPERLPARRRPPPVQTYNSIEGELDGLDNALVQVENWLPGSAVNGSAAGSDANSTPPPPSLSTLYFCLPHNDKLLTYWDTVEDRLFKICHCMNIEGVVRQLPLFEPPLDPALLVKAAAAGVDISSALSDINAALPHYRFNVMVQKALELCNDLKSLGAALLSALEKRDAEALALLRSNHEIRLLNAVKQIREQQIKEVEETLEGLKKTHEVIAVRRNHYQQIPDRIPEEDQHLEELATSQYYQTHSQASDLLGSIWGLIPDISVSVPVPPGFPVNLGNTWGGSNLSEVAQAVSRMFSFIASQHTYAANMASILGGWVRRRQEWDLQLDLATTELEQIDKQIAAAEIRLAIAEHELKNHDLQVENAKEVDAFMRDKYTNQALYDWLVGQISGLYFRSYHLAYDVAKRAERAYRFELGLPDSNFIQFGYWDSLKKGLMAGERLSHDLKRLELAYLDQHKREYEITKHVSLRQHNPLALIALKETGQCEIELPEALFDLDFPGHYFRRIKSVSLTIPCVVGPYTSVNATLTLLSSAMRRSATLTGQGYADPANLDTSYLPVQSIATSTAQNDSGLFELNFRDERYLPFEGAGAIGRWRLELAGKWQDDTGKVVDFTAFDFETISDVVLHMRYTAREGGGLLKQKAVKNLETALNEIAQGTNEKGLMRVFSLRHEFPTEWRRFISTADSNGDHIQAFSLAKDRFPLLFQGKTITVKEVELFGVPKKGATALKLDLELTAPGSQQSITLNDGADLGQLAHKTAVVDVEVKNITDKKDEADWSLKVMQKDVSVTLAPLANLLLVCRYEVSTQ